MSAPSDVRLPWWKTRLAFAVLCVAVIAAVFAAIDHWRHVVGAWPLLFLMACPLLHVLMHGSHGKHHRKSADTSMTDAAR